MYLKNMYKKIQIDSYLPFNLQSNSRDRGHQVVRTRKNFLFAHVTFRGKF